MSQEKDLEEAWLGSMSGYKQSKPNKSLEPKETLATFGTEAFLKFGETFISDEMLKRFKWKLPMKESSMVLHCEASLGCVALTTLIDSRRFFALSLYFHRVRT